MYRGHYYAIPNFKGGYCGNNPPTQLQLNEAQDCDNIVVGSSGKGIRSRLGTTLFPSSSVYGTPFVVVQDLTYTSVSQGSAGQLVSIAYTTGGTAGAEVVTVSNTDISIKIQSGVSTANQIRTAFNASAAATALATCTVSGTGTNTQTAPVTLTRLNTTAFNGGTNVQGIGYLLTAAQNTYLGAIVGNKFYRVTDGTDYTGGLTITAGSGNTWNMFPYQDTIIAFGGNPSSPDAPFQWSGTVNATALTGSAPQAAGGFSANNRVFAFNTTAAPSSVFWSVLGSANDWTSDGSGNAVVGSFSDNQRVTGAVVLSTNYALVFKEASTYQMVLTSSPFPVYSLFDSIGCVGKFACLTANGVAYWINQYGRMVSTDGESLKDYPPQADDLWNAVQKSQYKNICGFRQKGVDYDWIVWAVSTTGSTNNMAIVWDLINECWLKCSSGYKYNVAAKDTKNGVFLGGADGKIYQPDLLYFDAFDLNPVAAYWRSGWINLNTPDAIVQARRFLAQFATRPSESISVSYGFDFVPDSHSFTFSQTPSGSETMTSKRQDLVGRGNFFQYKVSCSSKIQGTNIFNITLGGKIYGQKKIGNT